MTNAQWQELKDANNGKFPAFAWPGGYPMYYVMDDAEAICPTCANQPTNPIHFDEPNDGWRILGYDINWEDPNMYCSHCNKRIESAYAEDDAPKTGDHAINQ